MRLFAILLASALSACATAQAPVNAPLTGAPAPAHERAATGEDLIILALSGGGARAASFQLGVLEGLGALRGRDGRPLSAHIALISAVSGGAVLAGYYGLHGDEGLDGFRAAYLDKDWRIASFYAPSTWARAWRGGANGPGRAAAWLDAEVYHGARLADMTRGPRIMLNATELYGAIPFAFTPFYFEGVCSDAGAVRVADAAAASMAVPMVFEPVLLEAYPQACAEPAWVARVLADRQEPEIARTAARAFRAWRTPAQQRYLHLSDGGVFDNFGLSSLALMRAVAPAPAPLTAREAVAARRILVLVVNAEYVRPRAWQLTPDGPGGAEMLVSSLDAATEAAKRNALDAFRAALPAFERDIAQFRCGLDAEAARALGAGDGWRCDEVRVAMDVITLADMAPEDYAALYDTPTRVSLPAATVSALIRGGRAAIEANAALAALRAD